ncbi:hypothetical protein Sgleb_70900 [Streptomyces glebosus]|uniref:Uncharacterized protein n=1 Tax=Streptomyces glebosus TaxID=249580 RepID=A0A640T5R9_9ACTN|nr:hypothetical protein [Streptomyces glebosus]GFE19043.1 hypothetical protein Sgleb_70900 [Streptomyces glebosus]GHG48287.1 hypothetical protein GCM10010513_05120 [Streptomyces glebosus]
MVEPSYVPVLPTTRAAQAAFRHLDVRARATARRIVEGGAFRGDGGTGPSAGERWLHSCAYGDGSRGSGNAETWIQAGHNQHMHFAMSQLGATG